MEVQWPAGTVIERDALRLDGDQEMPFAAQGMELREVAFQDQLGLVGRATLEGIAQPVSGIDIDGRRHVTPDGARVSTCQCRRQIDATRSFAATVSPRAISGLAKVKGATRLQLPSPSIFQLACACNDGDRRLEHLGKLIPTFSDRNYSCLLVR